MTIDYLSEHKFSVAPMIDVTDRHCRYLLRLISKRALLYSEMITTKAIINGDPTHLLEFSTEEHPLVLQLGGSDPEELASCVKIGRAFGYDEINLNCGCPSDRVQSGKFGACLMHEPELVRDCVSAMIEAESMPISVKCRTGLDQQDDFSQLLHFVDSVSSSGCMTFIIHARNAWLTGLSPKENRNIPPLKYDWVYRLKAERPDLKIVINGGIHTLEEIHSHLTQVDGVMMGREAYRNPRVLSCIDQQVFNENTSDIDWTNILNAYISYCDAKLTQGTALRHTAKHLLGIANGLPGARNFRQHLSTNMYADGADTKVITDALQYLQVSQ